MITLEKLGVNANDCLYIDDREGNLKTAENLGMKAIMLNSRKVEYNGNVYSDFKDIYSDWVKRNDNA